MKSDVKIRGEAMHLKNKRSFRGSPDGWGGEETIQT